MAIVQLTGCSSDVEEMEEAAPGIPIRIVAEMNKGTGASRMTKTPVRSGGEWKENYIGAEEYEKTMPEFEFRLQVKAGLTGYAQVTGLYDTLPYDKLKMDLMYIENYSIFLDLRIILMTLKTALFPGETNEEANAHDVQELLYQEEQMQEQEQEKGDHS